MSQTPRTLQPALSERHSFGAELRSPRGRANLSRARLSVMIRFGADLVCRVETVDRFPSCEFAEACDKALATGCPDASATAARISISDGRTFASSPRRG
nr:helix-turn-helix domain-containing protein [Salinispora cortesiana]